MDCLQYVYPKSDYKCNALSEYRVPSAIILTQQIALLESQHSIISLISSSALQCIRVGVQGNKKTSSKLAQLKRVLGES